MTWRDRTRAFCERFGLEAPVLLAPMAGACPPALSIAVMNAGGMGGCGALVMSPGEIRAWSETVRGANRGAFQINLWVPDPPPARDPAAEASVRAFLAGWGPEVPATAADSPLQDFEAQCEAVLASGAKAVSSIMGLFPAPFVTRLKVTGAAWLAAVSTLAEAEAAAAAGADVIIAQGMEAGGHRAAFDPARAEREMVGLMSLIPAIADRVEIPVVAAGGIADGRGAAAAFALGASAVLVGTAFLRTPQAAIAPAWADALAGAAPEATLVSRAFSGRPARSLATAYARAATAPGAPEPAPYPVQRGLTAPMRAAAGRAGDIERMQAWAGQSAALARAEPAGEVVARIWREARSLLA